MTQYHSLGKIIVAGLTGRNRIDGIDNEIWSYLANFAKLVSSAWQQEAYRDRILPTSAALLTYLQLDMNDLEREYFRVLFLDSENKLLADKLLWEGTVDCVHAYPREILRHAIGLSATALILVHNHVSSDPSPSNEDIRLTQHVIAACEPVDIVVHDHLIIARNAVFSLAQNACIQSDYAV